VLHHIHSVARGHPRHIESALPYAKRKNRYAHFLLGEAVGIQRIGAIGPDHDHYSSDSGNRVKPLPK